MKKAVAQVISLRAGLKPIVEEEYSKQTGEWSAEEMADRIADAIADIDLNQYAKDIARSLVNTEDNGRAAKTPSDAGGQLDLALVEDTYFNERSLLKLGDGTRVKTVDAKFQHGLVHQGKLNEKAADVAMSSQRHNKMLVLVQPYIEKNPRLTLLMAWKKYLKDSA